MPDQANPLSTSELESLINEAEQQAVTPCNNNPKPCLHTFDETQHTKCPTCMWSFCLLCASSLDPAYCHLCLNESSAELVESPLVDTEGVTHEGRLLTPTDHSTFFSPRIDINGVTLAKTISSMSDLELEEYIEQYKHLVHQAEKTLDFRRVVLGTSQLELTQRKQSQQLRLRNDKTKYPMRTVTLNKSTGRQRVSNASMSQMLDMLKALDAKVKARNDGGVK